MPGLKSHGPPFCQEMLVSLTFLRNREKILRLLSGIIALPPKFIFHIKLSQSSESPRMSSMFPTGNPKICKSLK